MLLGSLTTQAHLPCVATRLLCVALALSSGAMRAEDGPRLPSPQQDEPEFPNPSTVMKPVGPIPDPISVLGRASTFQQLLDDPSALPVGQTLPREMFLTDDIPVDSPGPVVVEPTPPRFGGEPPLLVNPTELVISIVLLLVVS